jgi:hypothetical protein
MVLKENGPEFPLFEPDYFYSAGYELPSLAKEFVTPRDRSVVLFRIEVRKGILNVGRALVDGNDCVQLTLKCVDSSYKFLVDPKLNYAVRQHEEMSSTGVRKLLFHCTDFVNVSGLWLPRRTSSDVHWFGSSPNFISEQPLFHQNYVVEELNNEPIPSGQFKISLNDQPGSFVSDGTLLGSDDPRKGTVSYRVPTDPSKLDEVVERAKREVGAGPIASRSNRRVLLVAGNVTVALLLGGLYMWRRRRRPVGPSN